MASHYTVAEVVDLVQNEDFGLFESESDEEGGEEIYPYQGQPVISPQELLRLGNTVESDSDGVASGISSNPDDFRVSDTEEMSVDFAGNSSS